MYQYELINQNNIVVIIITGPDNFRVEISNHLVTGKLFTEKSAHVFAQMHIQRLLSEKKEVIAKNIEAVTNDAEKTILSHYEFRKRFTFEEKVAIQASTDPGIQVLEKDLMAAPIVDITDEELNKGMDYYVLKQLLTQERRDKIMSIEEEIEEDNVFTRIQKAHREKQTGKVETPVVPTVDETPVVPTVDETP